MSDQPPEFSVIMPAYNTAATIADAVASVLSQTWPDFELVVVDDGSEDETPEIVSTFKDGRIRLVREENRGAAAARNAGIAASSGRLVAFLDSDDLWMPTYLNAMRGEFNPLSDAVVCYTDAWVIDAEHGRVGAASAMHWQRPPIPPPTDSEHLLLELLERNFIYASATIRRDLIDDIGPFDERLGAAIDYEMWLRVAARGYRVARLPGLHAIYRRGRSGSISSNRLRVWENLAEVYRIAAEEYDLPSAAHAKARSRLVTARREIAALEGQGGLDGVWRGWVRPALVSGRNAMFHRDRWRAAPPRELVEAFPALVDVSSRRER